MNTQRTALLVTSVLLVGCGPSGRGASDDIGGQESLPGADAPPGSELQAVEPLVEELLEDYDRVVNRIIGEPSVVADRDDPLVREYLDLYEPHSKFARGALDAWEANGAAGLTILPYDESHPALTTSLDDTIETVSDDEVTAPVCELHRRRSYQNGRLTEGVPLLEETATVTAVRVDRAWLLKERVAHDDVVGCTSGEG